MELNFGKEKYKGLTGSGRMLMAVTLPFRMKEFLLPPGKNVFVWMLKQEKL